MNKPVALVQNGKLTIQSAEVLGFDPQELRRKYDFERDRRLRPDGAAQYQDIDGDLDHYKDDPYITERIARAPVQETVEVVILGGGFGGLCMAALKINNGPFLNFSGVIEEIEPERGKLKVTVNIFGRNTPVELEYWQVDKA